MQSNSSPVRQNTNTYGSIDSKFGRPVKIQSETLNENINEQEEEITNDQERIDIE